jgi:hypothetical protein
VNGHFALVETKKCLFWSGILLGRETPSIIHPAPVGICIPKRERPLSSRSLRPNNLEAVSLCYAEFRHCTAVQPSLSLAGLTRFWLWSSRRETKLVMKGTRYSEEQIIGSSVSFRQACVSRNSTQARHSFSQGSVAQSGCTLLRSLYSSTFVDFDKRKPRNDFRWKRHVCAIARRRR